MVCTDTSGNVLVKHDDKALDFWGTLSLDKAEPGGEQLDMSIDGIYGRTHWPTLKNMATMWSMINIILKYGNYWKWLCWWEKDEHYHVQ